VLFNNKIQAQSLILKSIDAVRNLLRRVLREMFPFAMVRPNTCMMEEKPVVGFDGFWRALGVGDAMISVVCVNQILHDGPRFEQPNLAAVGVDVCQRREATVGVDSEEPGFLVSILGGIDFVKVVGQSVDWG
jgi:hypothetical protein